VLAVFDHAELDPRSYSFSPATAIAIGFVVRVVPGRRLGAIVAWELVGWRPTGAFALGLFVMLARGCCLLLVACHL
jgi:hypothetical protein